MCIALHLQDRLESGPTWKMHECGAECGVFLGRHLTEKFQLLL